MKKILIFIIAVIFPINVFALNIKSEYAILYNLNEDKIIYEVKPNDKVYIASMTKIMTCIVALENIDNLDSKITMTNDMFYRLAEENASVAGFKVGEEVSYRDLLYGLMLPSGADAAQALAIKTSGSIDNFVAKMNKKASDLKLSNTHFVNPTGLDNKNHYSTVYDVAQILKYSLKNDEFKKIFSANKYITSNKKHTFLSTRSKTNIDTSFIDGSKTGFTYDAGLCMASTSHYNNVNYLLVTAKAPYNNRTNHLIDAKNIYSYYFNNYEYRKISEIGDKIVNIELTNGNIVSISSNIDMEKYLSKKCNITKKYDGKSIITDEDKIADKLGTYIIKCDDEVLYTKDIYLNIDTSIEKNNNKIIIYSMCGIILVLVIVLIILRKRRR